MAADAIHVVIADDHPMVRRALVESVSEVLGGDATVTEAGSLAEAAAALAANATDLLLLDLNMPGMNGLIGLRSLRAAYPAVPILVISATEDPVVMRQVVEFGASGYLPKSTPVGAIGEALGAILAGDVWLPKIAAETYLDRADVDFAARVAELTPQQLRVLALLTEGKLNKQIAFELDVAEATVKAHISQIFKKLGVHSRTQAVISVRRFARSEPPGAAP